MIPPRPRQTNRGPMPGAGPGRRLRLFRRKDLRPRLQGLLVCCRFLLLPWILSLWPSWRGRPVRHLCGPARGSAGCLVVAVVPYLGQADLLASFLDYHARIGVPAFVFLDLSEAGDLAERLASRPGCAVWRAAPGHTPDQVLHWLNRLRRRYATGRWCLSIEVCDRFVFHRCETRKIGDLIDFLESERRSHLYGLVVEMYGEGPVAAGPAPGQDPLGLLPYFDPLGYVTSEPGPDRSVTVRGGVRRRTLFAAAPRRAPALNRVPLVRWRRFHAYIAGTRVLIPSRLNAPHAPWHTSPTAVLLRFALLQPGEALERSGDGDGLRGRALRQPFSRRYMGSEDLVDCGLLNPGQWF